MLPTSVEASTRGLPSSIIFDAWKQAVPAGVLLALAGHLFTQSKARHDIEEKTSQFNLDDMRLAFLHAKSLLEGGSNDRATWIEAALTIAHGFDLAKGVTAEAYQRVLEVEQLKYRGIFQWRARFEACDILLWNSTHPPHTGRGRSSVNGTPRSQRPAPRIGQ